MISSCQVTLSQSTTTIARDTTTDGTGQTVNNGQTASVTQTQNQESKDDFVIDDNINTNNIIINVPSFIRLFVIRRIIDKHIKNNKGKKTETKEEIIKEMANVYKDDKKYQSLAINIVTRLINDGIKKYIDKWYNEKIQANIIEDIFNKIILKKFGQEFNEITKYGLSNINARNDKKNDNYYNYYQNLLFNSRDLMNQIFQYLEWGYEFDKDLYSCSLVNSHWLYHVWNVNSVYFADLGCPDFSKFSWQQYTNKRKQTRTWQRLYNAKSIRFGFNLRHVKAITTINKLGMFRKVEKVDVIAHGNEVDKCISALIPIMSRCKDRIKYCRIKIHCYGSDSSDFKVSSRLRLPKAQCVEIGDLFFYRIWTNECTRLKLFEVNKIRNDWFKFVIENCDCSNINILVLDRVTFDDNSINEMILKQFALKFNNLKTVKMEIDGTVDNNMLLFLQSLRPIISKNKTQVQLKVHSLRHDKAILLSQRMDEKYLKIDKLIVGKMARSMYNDAIKLIQERDNRSLNHLTIEGTISETKSKKLLNVLECKSITTFELKDSGNIRFANALLKWKTITEKQIFVIIDVYKNRMAYVGGSGSLVFFQKLCDNIYQLFVQQIALDIKIKFRNIEDSKSYLSRYSSYFENLEFLSKYNKPKCNSNLYLPRDKPYTYFYIHDLQEEEKYFVFGATNVQIK